MTKIIEYDVTEAAITKLGKERDDLLNADDLDFEAIKDGKKRNGRIRIAIEKKRKELKAEALQYGRDVDSKAKGLSSLVEQIENSYIEVLDKRGAEIEAARVEELRIENTRIAAIKDQIAYYTSSGIGPGFSANELISESEHLNEYLTSDFDFQEFKEEADAAYKTQRSHIDNAMGNRRRIDAEKEQLEAQRKKDNEDRAKLEAEKAAFEIEQKKAKAKIDAEMEALQKHKDIMQQAENDRIHKEQEISREAEFKKAAEEAAKQRAIDAEIREKAAEIERLRLEKVAKEEAERKVKQANEDRVRNAAPDMLKALELIIEHNALDGAYQHIKDAANNAIKLAKGE